MNNKKILLAISAIVVIVVIAILILKSPKTQAPAEIGETEENGTEMITPEKVNQELENIDSGDVEGELKDIDAELKNL